MNQSGEQTWFETVFDNVNTDDEDYSDYKIISTNGDSSVRHIGSTSLRSLLLLVCCVCAYMLISCITLLPVLMTNCI